MKTNIFFIFFILFFATTTANAQENLIKTFKGHTSDVLSVCFSPDGKYLATGSVDNSVKIWNTETGNVMRTLTGHQYSVYSDYSDYSVYSVYSVNSVCFSPDGKTLASVNYQEIKIWNTETGQEIRTLTGHTSFVNSVCFSPDGKYLASGSRDNFVKIWNTETGNVMRTLTGHSNYVLSVCFSPDGKYLASGSEDKSVKIWNTETGRLMSTLTGHTSSVKSVCFSPDGEYIASGSFDNSVKIWYVATIVGEIKGVTIRTSLISSHSVLQTYVKKYVEDSISVWQEKGRKETTADYQKRIKEKRQAKINQFASDAVKGVVEKREQKFMPVRKGVPEYDADKQVYLLHIDNFLNFVLPVPSVADEVEKFDDAFRKNKLEIVAVELSFKMNSNKLKVRKFVVKNKLNDKTYTYDSPIREAYKSSYFENVDIVREASEIVIPKKKLISDVDNEKNDPSNTLAVIIGIEEYKKAPKAKYSDKDAQSFYEYAKNTFNIPASNIYFLTNDSATKGEFDDIFFSDVSDFRRRVTSQTDVIIFYSGHGIPDPETLEGYIIPYDCNPNNPKGCISLKSLYESLNSLNAKSVTVFIDACFSGTDRETKLYSENIKAQIRIKINPVGNLTIFSSSSGTEYSQAYDKEQHGLFTYFLLKGLQNSKQLTVQQLFDFINENVTKTARDLNKLQTPTLQTNEKERIILKK